MSFDNIAILLTIVALLAFVLRPKTRYPLPPGPQADLVLGHLRIFPSDNEGIVFHEWAQQYGDVVYVKVPGRSVIILDSVEAATDLMEKRSAIYSDRPVFTVLELVGFLPDLGFLPYGKRFQKHRRMMQSSLTQDACIPWRDAQTVYARQLANNLAGTSSGHESHMSWFTTALIVKVAYGFDIESKEDEYVQLAEKNEFILNNCGTPGGTMVDFFPFLQHFPSWFPGTHYANFARKWRWVIRRLYDMPYERVRQAIDNGDDTPSLVAHHIKKLDAQAEVTEDDIEDVKSIGAVAFAAGAETTASTLMVFLLAMTLHPEHQRRAQAEIDEVVGEDRLPEFEDRKSLPFVECLVQEVLRWHPVVPLGEKSTFARRILMLSYQYQEYRIAAWKITYTRAC
ncbi:hypothetical protein HGRIS_000977 [Hohenbuehelia grisea]|uniref:Cytochrome P450 n=1 Tax=Hohenbuehelia grisea TaxID=104357 RepID=A0ABR3IQD3_9AGAR